MVLGLPLWHSSHNWVEEFTQKQLMLGLTLLGKWSKGFPKMTLEILLSLQIWYMSSIFFEMVHIFNFHSFKWYFFSLDLGASSNHLCFLSFSTLILLSESFSSGVYLFKELIFIGR